MKILGLAFKRQFAIASVLVLALLNITFFGGGLHEQKKTIDASGFAFSSNGTVLKVTGRLVYKGDDFIFTVNYKWSDKSSTMVEFGTVAHGFLGEKIFTVNGSSSIGPDLLGGIGLDEEILLFRTIMQSVSAKVIVLPLENKYDVICYYLLFSNRVFCGVEDSGRLVIPKTESVDSH